MTILQGLQEVHELLEKRGAIAKIASAAATTIQTGAQRIWTATMLESTAATVAFRIALDWTHWRIACCWYHSLLLDSIKLRQQRKVMLMLQKTLS
jgi:hypothetical protein